MAGRREVLHHCLVHPHVNVKEYLENDPEAYTTKEEFLEPLTLIYRSLLDSGDTYIAHGRVLDFVRQVRPPALAEVSFGALALASCIMLYGRTVDT